jgi:hypothetical protein
LQKGSVAVALEAVDRGARLPRAAPGGSA